MTTSDLDRGAVAAALTAPELDIRERLQSRFDELAADSSAREILRWYGMEHLLDDDGGERRVFDLAAAVHHLENALDGDRAALPKVELMEPDDIARHPGFDDVEQEILDEEEFLLALRRSLRDG
ncbi:hypothetical protein ACFOSC_32015 [Streptantibioticus rubrisoli]|uniref:Uncharacterized protein n=1 Tax=Streptantibioticus rubrisoli TaxID=1387313 RepID=A0ABT1P917_9ACTN|nr:hypothetical protein [Streptantibioticus rubrisoli]MCQ4041857.1 hypothetical protein [Streptantibioticus rubrisoli]